jgi:sortase (surface protein transpeptidase)
VVSSRRPLCVVLGSAGLALIAGALPSAAQATTVDGAASDVASVSREDRSSRAHAEDPVRLRIPAIGVNAAIVRLGLNRDGTLGVPTTAALTGWFTGSPVPGARGPAIVDGHVHWNGQAGVFARLSSLRYDDRILVTRSDGMRVTFRVTRVSRFSKSSFPSELVYGDTDEAGLRLITCDGYDSHGHAYLDNLVVFAVLV